MIIGSRIKEARKKQGLTQTELGNLLGVSKVSICSYELGNRTPTMNNFIDMVNILGVDPDYLFGRDISVVGDNEEYGMKMAKEDIQILKEIKNNKELYSQLFKDPKRTVELISRRLK